MPEPAPSPWWSPQTHQDRRPALVTRGRIKRAVQAWFQDAGFTEVETAALQVSPGNEAHLHAFTAEAIGSDGVRRPLYLRTSPEFACKALLAAGETKIFDFARVWRNRERGPLHHPEFTMLEWYRAQAPYEVLMQDCGDLLALAAESAGAAALTWKDRTADPFAEPERLTVAEAFHRIDIDLMATLEPDGATDRAAMAAAATVIGERVSPDDTWSDLFSRLIAGRIEPLLGLGRPTILYEYPVAEAALARPTSHDPRVAERFELYACGVELANAFGELTDPAEQRRRFETEMDEKARVYGERYPIDPDFLAALGRMPEASGAAMGFDRLVMLTVGASRIEQVLWSPVAGS